MKSLKNKRQLICFFKTKNSILLNRLNFLKSLGNKSASFSPLKGGIFRQQISLAGISPSHFRGRQIINFYPFEGR